MGYLSISMVGLFWWDIFGGISGEIALVGYLGIEMINVASTTVSDLSALRLSERVCGIPDNLSD